ncbi:MAG: lipopolysaccharide kinase InaA family protein [Planctomycetota bacterium]|nr:lipopolysaccharide kinase InaA family protein [Planctomycetota bacterium]
MSRIAMPSSGSVRDFEAPPYRGLLERDVERVLLAELLAAPEARARAGRILSENRYRVTSRVPVREGRALLVKVHRARGLGERLLSWFKPSRARTEWAIARHLAAIGIPVPRPFAYGEARTAGTLSGAFFVGEFLDGVKRLDEALCEDQPRAKQRALLRRAVGLIRAMHDRGFDHRDLHAGNILVKPGPGDVRAMTIVDLHRARMGAPLGRARRAAALGKWLHSIQDQVHAGARLRLVGAYLGEGASRDVRRAFYARVERVRRRIHTRWLASRAKRCFKESTSYTRDVGAGRGYRSRRLTLERLEDALREHETALALDDARVAKRGRKGLVTVHGDLVVKETIPADWLGRLKDRLAPDRHRHAYGNAHRLAFLGVHAAQPLAYLRRRGRVFSLFTDLSAYARLDLLARDTFRSGDPDSARSLLRDSADWLGTLHRRGVYHGDLKGVNVRVDASGARHVFWLIDTDRVLVGGRPVAERRRIKNLAQLAASIPRDVTRTDRLRWFRRYQAALGLVLDERAVARAVAGELAQKIVVVDEPIE